MNEAKFTPGPWFVEDEDDKTIVCVKDGEICDIVVDHRPHKENLANAHLIAAAPEMYELLQDMLNHSCRESCVCCLSEDFEDRIWELLKKARGEV